MPGPSLEHIIIRKEKCNKSLDGLFTRKIETYSGTIRFRCKWGSNPHRIVSHIQQAGSRQGRSFPPSPRLHARFVPRNCFLSFPGKQPRLSNCPRASTEFLATPLFSSYNLKRKKNTSPVFFKAPSRCIGPVNH